MSDLPLAARQLATAFLCGEWSYDGLLERGRSLLGPKRGVTWLPRVATSVMYRFGSQPLPPRWFLLAQFLSDEPNIGRFEAYFHSNVPNLLSLPHPQMQTVAALAESLQIPPLVTPGQLAEWLEVTPSELDWFADRHSQERRGHSEPLRHYRYRQLPKRNGRPRLLEIPKQRLKRLQRQILDGILHRIAPHSAAHAYFPGRGVSSFVHPHGGRHVLLHVDLREFFPSIGAARIRALFRTIGYPEAVADLLTGLCTNAAPASVLGDDVNENVEPAARRLYAVPHLPQGAPTSPALANLCAFRLDRRLSALAERFDARYSRYADDLLFSGDRTFTDGLKRFRVLLLAIALDEGFEIRARKTRVLFQHKRQAVAGVVLNAHPNPPRDEYDRLKATLFNCVRFGPASQNREQHPHYCEHLQGRIAYLQMINVERGRKLQVLFDRIVWDPSSPATSNAMQPEGCTPTGCTRTG